MTDHFESLFQGGESGEVLARAVAALGEVLERMEMVVVAMVAMLVVATCPCIELTWLTAQSMPALPIHLNVPAFLKFSAARQNVSSAPSLKM